MTKAAIGLAMGIQGTKVAKESSDISILDDNFASVVKVVRWGRSVYANIQKFIQFQLTVNVAALVINVVAAVTTGHVPLNACGFAFLFLLFFCFISTTFLVSPDLLLPQLLWVNFIMDTLGALALATEPPTDHLMHRSPVGRREPLITNIMWRNLLVQVFNELNARKPDEMNVFGGITKNRLFVAIVVVTIVLQIDIIAFLGKFTDTANLTGNNGLRLLPLGSSAGLSLSLGNSYQYPKLQSVSLS